MNHANSVKTKAIMDKFDALYEITMLLRIASQRLTSHLRRCNLTYEDSKRLKDIQELAKYFHNRAIELLGDFADSLEEEKTGK